MIALVGIMKRRNLVPYLFAGISASMLLSATAATAAQRMRWDIVSFNFSVTPNTISAGGTASAFANDGSSIKFTGSGTFLSVGPSARFSAVALGGGGTWQTFGPTGASSGSGTYTVLRGPASFQSAVGSGGPLIDLIGNADNRRAGLLVIEIRYNDGSRGILTVSCHVGTDTPDSVFEGITATKDFADYWFRFNPVPGVDTNRTVFHLLSTP